MVCWQHMKPTILHGENIVASRQRLNSLIDKLKEKNYEIIRLDEPKRDELILQMRSQGLFNEKKCIIVENFFGASTSQVEAQIFVNSHFAVVFWEKRQLTPATVKKLQPHVTLQEFKVPSTLFPLLDNVFPGNTKKLLSIYESGKTALETELIFAMLTRSIRMLLWAKLDPNSLNIPPWQRGKLIAQAGKFSELELLGLHTKLLEIDRAAKTSKLPEDLSSSLELLFASL